MNSEEFLQEILTPVHEFCRVLDGNPPAYCYVPLKTDEARIRVMQSRLFNELRAADLFGTWLKTTPEFDVKATMAESGLPGFEFTSWYGILAPAATPRAIVLRLNETINRILNQADLKENLNSQAMLTIGGTPEAFAGKIKNEMLRWGKVVKDTGAKAD